MDLELKSSCGTTVTLTCELPDSVRFLCWVPGVGLTWASVDPRGDAFRIIDIEKPGPDIDFLTDMGAEQMSAVIEQAGDVCAVFEKALDSVRVWEDETLRAIADMALHETELRAAWERLPGAIRARQCSRDEVPFVAGGRSMTPSKGALARFISDVLVERAQDMAEAAAKRRQAQWEGERELSRVEVRWSDAVDASIKRKKEEGP